MPKYTTSEGIEFEAAVARVQTMADGSVNVVMNLPEDCREQAKIMMDWLKCEVKAVIAV